MQTILDNAKCTIKWDAYSAVVKECLIKTRFSSNFNFVLESFLQYAAENHGILHQGR